MYGVHTQEKLSEEEPKGVLEFGLIQHLHKEQEICRDVTRQRKKALGSFGGGGGA